MQKYNICFSLDSNYVEQFCVSAVSILENATAQDNIDFYILDGGLTKKDKSNIEFLKKYKNFNLEYIKIDGKEFVNCPLLKENDENHKDYHVTIPGYFRFKLPELLPTLDKILYLDCDVIIRSSLNELFDIDLKDKSAAMVEDVDASKELERLNLQHYYNSGIMLINLDYWRKNDIQSKLFKYVSDNAEKIVWQDQDVINAVLAGSILPISNKWNYQYFLYEKIESKELNDCVILHLAGRFKPWIMPFEHFIYDCYYYYLLMTPFKNKVFEYRLNGSGRFLKDNIGGSVTNIRLNASDEYVYTWFLKVEKKVTEETDVKLSKLYDDILKNYNYANEISGGVDDKVKKIYEEITKCYGYTNELTESLKNKVSDLDAQTDEKITKIYDEISKNYDYTNSLVEELKENASQNTVIIEKSEGKSFAEQDTVNALAKDFDAKVANIYEELVKNKVYSDEKALHLKEEINSETDFKMAKVYEEISKNYDYTSKINSETKALTYELKEEINSETDFKIGKVYEEVSKNYDYTYKINEEAKALTYELKEEFDKKLFKAKDDIFSYTDHCFDKVQHNAFEKISLVENSLNDKILQLSDNQNKNLNHRLSEVYSYANSQLSKAFNEIRENNSLVETRINDKINEDNVLYNESKNSIENLWNELENKTDFNKIEELQNDFASKFASLSSTYETQISSLKSDFETMFNEQKMHYEAKLYKMETKLQEMEKECQEGKKSFLQKLIEKYKKR